jgi:hypothetical protein
MASAASIKCREIHVTLGLCFSSLTRVENMNRKFFFIFARTETANHVLQSLQILDLPATLKNIVEFLREII